MRIHEVPVPEPDLTPEAVIGRAWALIPAIRDQQDEAERLGHHTAELDRRWRGRLAWRIGNAHAPPPEHCPRSDSPPPVRPRRRRYTLR